MFYWIPALCWAGVIFFLSGRTGSELESMFPFFGSLDWGHLAAFFVLSFFVFFALRKTTAGKNIIAFTILICFLYGISDEVHQHFVPGRTPQLSDIFNDVLGAVLGVFAARKWETGKRNRY
ncbi:MAG: VanZ family protein [Desulfitobacteriaceae bacterium]|nr:VanZ family protein [Desulfitobacteriaceae bacterium]